MDATQAVLSIFLVAMALSYLIVRVILARRSRPVVPRDPEPADVLAPDLAAMLPALPSTKQELQQLLWTAGRYRPSALTEHLAVRAVLVVAAVMATGLLVVVAPLPSVPWVLVGGLVAAGLGFSVPRLILNSQATSRARRIVRGLPLAMDVLGLCLTAGQNVLNSLMQTSRQLVRSCPDLALELRIVQQQARMHSLEQALLQWAERLNIAEVRSLALLLVQSERLGTDMVNTLLEVADSQRILQRQKVEAQANRANFWMLFPTLFCLWTASAIVLVGPVYIEFWDYRREQMKTLIGNARGQVERTKTAQPANTTAGQEAIVTPVQPR
jgi:tight adherence protein C